MGRLEKVKILVVVALCAAAAGLYSFKGGYDTISRNVLPNLTFEEGLAHWRVNRYAPELVDGEPRTVALRTPEGSPAAYLMQLIGKAAERFTHIRVSADVRPLKVPEGEFWWQGAVVMMRSFRKDFHEIPYWPNQLVTTSGTREWTSYEEVFPVHPDAEFMQFIVNLGGPEGTILVRNIVVDAVREEIWFSAAKWILMAAWIAAGTWIALPLVFRRGGGTLPFAAGVVGLAILIAALIPQPRYSTVVGQVATTIGGWLATSEATRSRPASSTTGEPIRRADQPTTPTSDEQRVAKGQSQPRNKHEKPNIKQDNVANPEKKDQYLPRFELPLFGVHFHSHMLLAIIVFFAYRNKKFGVVFLGLCVFSVISEFVQYFSVTRTTQFVDLLHNFGGIVVGVTACLGWNSLARHVPALVPARQSPVGEARRKRVSSPLD